MAFMQQDTRILRDPKTNAIIRDDEGRPITENVGEPYQCVYVQNKETGEVTPQSAKAALSVFIPQGYRILNNESGGKIYAEQQKASKAYERRMGQIEAFEEDAPELTSTGDGGDGDGDTDDDGSGNAGAGSGTGTGSDSKPSTDGPAGKKPAPAKP